MSLFGSLFTGVSALQAQSSSMGIISNNIANVSTVGYKENYADFSSLVTTQATTGDYSPGGVLANTEATIGNQGTLEQTTSGTDLAISGNGFFVVRPEPDSTAPVYYTRAGSFTQDSEGYLRNSAGMVLYGWPLDASGNLPASVSDISSLSPVNVALQGGQAKPTTTATLSLNINSATAAAGTYSKTITVYDSLGTAETMNLTFTKSSTNNKWTLAVQDGSGNNLLPTNTNHNPHDNTVDVDFNADGTVSQVGATSGTTTLTVNGAAGTGINWGNGSSGQSISLDLSSLTQYSSPNNVVSITQDGATLGLRTGVQVDNNGIVSATYSNGTTSKIYQLPISTFSDPNGLLESSGNVYTATTASGSYNLRQAGASGAGSVAPSSLEQSNVDLATEFSKMIITQRAYSAATKVITTVDQMLQDLLQAR